VPEKGWTIRTIFVKGAISNYQNGANNDTSKVEKVSQKTPLFENVCRELTEMYRSVVVGFRLRWRSNCSL